MMMSQVNWGDAPTTREPLTEQQKRWLSWQKVTHRMTPFGNKHSFQGIDPAEKVKRRVRSRAEKQARKAKRNG